jgi:tripartite-type tricarboxylate transporter receptor subunit TctC
MRSALGQPIVVENIGGAAGTLGVARAARAPADGYTLSMGFVGTHVMNGAIYKLPYDLLSDFEPVSLIATNPWLIVARQGLPANDLSQLIAWLRANPDKASQGTAGVGTPHHLAGALFQKVTGTRFQFVPYRGAAPAMQDLMAGHIDLIFDGSSITLPQIHAGSIKAYAVAANRRLMSAPEIPTVDDAGLPGFYLSSWNALWVPKRTPKGVVEKLNAALANGLDDPGVRTRIAGLGMEIYPRDQRTPEALHAFQKAEIERWWPVIKELGIKPE